MIGENSRIHLGRHAIAIGCALLVAAGGIPMTVSLILSTVHRDASNNPDRANRLGGSVFVMQRGLLDCGPATAANFLRVNGIIVSFDDLRREFNVSLTGVSLDDVRVVLRRRKLETSLQSFLSYSRESQKAAAIVLKDHHYILVLPLRTAGKYRMIDPWSGVRIVPSSYFPSTAPVLIRAGA
jgi:hypothetical protein